MEVVTDDNEFEIQVPLADVVPRSGMTEPDLSALLAPVGDDMKPVVEESKQLRARLAKTGNEYDEGIIDGRRWRSTKQNAQAKLREIDKKLATRKGGAALARSPSHPIPLRRFGGPTLMAQRAVIDALCRLQAYPRIEYAREDGVTDREAPQHARITGLTVPVRQLADCTGRLDEGVLVIEIGQSHWGGPHQRTIARCAASEFVQPFRFCACCLCGDAPSACPTEDRPGLHANIFGV